MNKIDPAMNSRPRSLNARPANSWPKGSQGRQGSRLPVIEDPHRHPGMPPPERDRPIDIRDQCIYLSKVAEIVVPQAESTLEEMVACEKLRGNLLLICREVVRDAAKQEHEPIENIQTSLDCFGSLRSGIALRGSDMDLLFNVISVEGKSLVVDLNLPRRIQKALLKRGYGARLLTTTRVPLLKVCTQPHEDLLIALWRELREWEESQVSGGSDARLIRLYRTAIGDGWYNDADKKTIKAFEDAVENSKGNAKEPSLCVARTMLSKLPKVLNRYTGPKTIHDLKFPIHGMGIQCDINFSSQLGRHNTQLVRCYMRCDERLRQMIIFVKAWAKNREINKSFNGTLCSFGYVLMVLHYALNVANPPLCPNLQHQLSAMRGGADDVPRTCEGYNIQFWRNEKQVELAASRGMITYNEQSIGSLLRGFFSYYSGSQRAFNWATEVISIRSAHGILTKTAKGWTAARSEILPGLEQDQPSREVRHRFLLAIEDPFEVDHNVARSVTHFGMCALRDEFRRAHRLIQHGGLMGEMAIDMMERGDPKEVVYPGMSNQADRIIEHRPTKDLEKPPHKEAECFIETSKPSSKGSTSPIQSSKSPAKNFRSPVKKSKSPVKKSKLLVKETMGHPVNQPLRRPNIAPVKALTNEVSKNIC